MDWDRFREAEDEVTNLVEEHILAVNTFRGIIFQHSFRTNSMFGTQFLPEFETNCKTEREPGGFKTKNKVMQKQKEFKTYF